MRVVVGHVVGIRPGTATNCGLPAAAGELIADCGIRTATVRERPLLRTATVRERPVRRPAFTLTELIVSIGVLALMMTMAGAVFHLTLKSTGEAKALTTVNQRVRAFEQTLRADLRGIRPETCALVIVPAKMNAYWTAAGRDADDNNDPSDGYPHPEDLDREVHVGTGPTATHKLAAPRADRLMFVTVRDGASVVDPSLASGLQTVVYGHAVLGEWKTSTVPPTWRLQYGENDSNRRRRFVNAMLKPNGDPQTGLRCVFPTPAQDWHLARRGTLLVAFDGVDPPPRLDKTNAAYSPAVAFNLDDCKPSNPTSDPFACPDLGDIPYTQDEPVRLALAEGRQDVVAYPMADDASVPFNYLRDMVYDLGHASGQGIEQHPQWYARSELDLTPPAPIAERLGHYFLPHCASFQVEFALDLPELRGVGEVLWIDPADLVTGVDDWNDPNLDPKKWSPTRARFERLKERIKPDSGTGVLGPYDIDDPSKPANRAYDRLGTLLQKTLDPTDPDLGVRFTPDPVGGTPMARWYTSAPEGTTPDPLYPVALRVTIDVYDDEQRFERPLRHVMVFELGG